MRLSKGWCDVVSLSILMMAAVCVAPGAVVTWLVLRTKSAVLRERAAQLGRDLDEVREDLKKEQSANKELRGSVAGLESTLQEERKSNQEKLALLNNATERLREAFQALAADALK